MAGAISPARFERLYAARGGAPGWIRSLFERPSADPIRISAASAPLLLNLLWPLGLTNRTAFNAHSPLARASFRPCCDNFAFFQDCNHGSALLGLYHLAAAIYFRAFESLGWSEVDAARLMGQRYSSARGWRRNVDARLRTTGLRRGADSSGSGCAA